MAKMVNSMVYANYGMQMEIYMIEIIIKMENQLHRRENIKFIDFVN